MAETRRLIDTERHFGNSLDIQSSFACLTENGIFLPFHYINIYTLHILEIHVPFCNYIMIWFEASLIANSS